MKILILLFLASVAAESIPSDINLTKEVKAASSVTLPGWEYYLTNITQDFIYEIEEFGLCRHLLPDFMQEIDRDFFGMDLKGNISYRNGFIGNMEEVSYRNDIAVAPSIIIDDEKSIASMKINVFFTSLNMFYDYFLHIEPDIYFSGTVAIPYRELSFTLWVQKNFTSNKVTGYFDCCGGYILTRKWFYEPANDFTAIFNRDAVLDILDTVKKNYSETVWIDLLNNALSRRTFPELCYYCPSKLN